MHSVVKLTQTSMKQKIKGVLLLALLVEMSPFNWQTLSLKAVWRMMSYQWYLVNRLSLFYSAFTFYLGVKISI